MRTQLRHISPVAIAIHSDLFFGMAIVAIGLLAFLAYTVYTLKQENGYWILVRRRGKKEKADEDLLVQAGAIDPNTKKDIDLEGGKRPQYVVEDLYRFKTVTSQPEEMMGMAEGYKRGFGRC